MIQIDTGLLELLPDFYRPIKDYQEIMSAEEAELADLQDILNAVHDNFFVQTMDAATTQSWENLLGILPIAGESLEFRRERVLNRMSTNPPFTLEFLYARLDEILGPGKWDVLMDYANYTLYIEQAAEDQGHSIEVAYTVNNIKPAHIIYIARPLLSAGLLASEAVSASGVSHNYRLGSWSLGALPFDSTVSEVIYKMASVASIQNSLLNGIASFISTDVSKARVNSSIDITSLTKSTSGNVTTITYAFTTSQASAINKIELLDSSNNVLMSSNVYIPVASDLQIKHTFTTKEGV